MTDTTSDQKSARPAASPRLASPLFLAIQATVLIAVCAIGYYLYAETSKPLAMATLRDEPRIVPPMYDFPVVVSDEQLVAVLTKLAPRLGDDPPVASVDHALRFWGVEATFDDPAAWSGEKMRDFLVDNSVFRARGDGHNIAGFLVNTDEGGVRFRTLEGKDSSSHVDHTLACLAEVGTPLSFLLKTDEGQRPLKSVLEQSMRDFSLNQVEYEWSGMALALYANAPGHWTTTEGQDIDFDLIATRTMRQRLPEGVCQGNHRLHTLVMLLRIDDNEPILSPERRAEIFKYLQGVTADLVAKQNSAEGYWGQNWPIAANGAGEPSDAGKDSLDRQSWRILVTGHVLEWWALAPEEILPPRHVIVSAAQWTVKAVTELSDAELKQHYGPLSHAGRALALWRKKWPHEVKLSLPPAPPTAPEGETPPPAGQ